MTACSISWCDREAIQRGLCGRCYQRRRLGIDPDKPPQRQATEETWEKIREEATLRREAGEDIQDIATRFGVSRGALSKRLREWGVKPGIKHGTLSGWQYRKCRCDECSAARTEYKRALREAWLAKPVTAPHETETAYRQGCRCDACVGVMRAYERDKNDRTRPGAENHGRVWTGADAEIAVTRTDLTILERAAMLGRTYAAVDNYVRAYHRRPDDPHGLK